MQAQIRGQLPTMHLGTKAKEAEESPRKSEKTRYDVSATKSIITCLDPIECEKKCQDYHQLLRMRNDYHSYLTPWQSCPEPDLYLIHHRLQLLLEAMTGWNSTAPPSLSALELRQLLQAV